MRYKVSKDEVAQMWATQSQSHATVKGNGNFYFEGKTIYSYGSHFPIARFVGNNDVLFTLKTYSNTTAKHINEVRYVCNKYHKDVIYAYDINYKDDSIEYWINNIKSLIDEIKNPNNRKFDSRLSSIKMNAEQLKKYVDYFNITLSFEDSTLLAFVQANNLVEQLREGIKVKKIKKVKILKHAS